MPKRAPRPAGHPAEIPSPSTLRSLNAVMLECTRCDLFLSRTQVVPGDGPADSRILLVGEAPGANEDRAGRPFVGRSGALLDRMLDEAGIGREAVFIANVVRCRPPENRNPTTFEIRACTGWLREQIRLIRPRVTVPLGRFALQHFLPASRITTMQGEPREIDYEGRTLLIFPLLHPSAVLRNPTLRASYAAQFRRLVETVER
jgi:uracil-DNA glycosylase